MSYEIDVHTHTIASGHAYSTMQEMIVAAQEKGLKGLGITEHAPSMTGTCQAIYFHNLRIVPRMHKGLRLFLGVELNIMDREGHVDLDEDSLRKLDIRIASVHGGIYQGDGEGDLNHAIKGVMNNPYVDIIGHPDDGNYHYDYKMLAELAAEKGKIIEINNSSLRPTGVRLNAFENDLRLLEECKKCQVSIMIGSDAHISSDVGAHEMAKSVLEQGDYPKELILNYHMDQFLERIEEHK